MLKNVSGQAIGSQVLDRNTGTPFLGTVTCYVTGDAGVQAAGQVNGGLCVHEGHGYYTYTPSQAETNYTVVAFTFDGATALPATVQVAPIPEAQAAAISSSTITTVIGDGPTRVELLHQLAHRLNKTPPPSMDSATEARLASYLNQRQRRLLTMPGLARLREASLTLTSQAGQAAYGVTGLAKVQRMVETTNERVLYEMSAQDYRLLGTAVTGTPEAYVWTGRQVVARQPLGPTSLFLWSSNVSDVTNVVYVEGATADGLQSVAVVLTGTTPVNISSVTTNWLRVDKWYLAAPCRGDVFLGDDVLLPTPLTLGCIRVGQVTTDYTGLTLWPTPSDAVVYTVDITRALSDLVHDTDQAALPVDFSDLLVLGALADEYQHLADSRWSLVMTEYKERENQLKYWLAETAIGRPFGLSRSWQRPSQLGAWFPAGT
jgi:hypothetical protein